MQSSEANIGENIQQAKNKHLRPPKAFFSKKQQASTPNIPPGWAVLDSQDINRLIHTQKKILPESWLTEYPVSHARVMV